MSAFCPDCKREVVWATTQIGQRIALSVPPDRRYVFTQHPTAYEIDAWRVHECLRNDSDRIKAVQEMVGDLFHVDVKVLKSKSRAQHVVFARQVAMYLCRQLTDASTPVIGKAFHRDHSTVIHALIRIGGRMHGDSPFRSMVERVELEFSQRAAMAERNFELYEQS